MSIQHAPSYQTDEMDLTYALEFEAGQEPKDSFCIECGEILDQNVTLSDCCRACDGLMSLSEVEERPGGEFTLPFIGNKVE